MNLKQEEIPLPGNSMVKIPYKMLKDSQPKLKKKAKIAFEKFNALNRKGMTLNQWKKFCR